MTGEAKPLCIIKDLRKDYRVGDIKVQALRGINLEIRKGDFIAIMGASGSGKTTLLNILGCLDLPTSGEYLLDGTDVSRLTDDEISLLRNRYIGFIFQNFNLLPYATVFENVLLPTIYSDNRSGDGKALVNEVLSLVGLEERARFKPRQLSGGQQQRVAIARALINRPELILADEPTGQLDSNTAREIMAIIKRLNSTGKTVVIVTHDREIASCAERIIHMKDGMIQNP
jgi:putative ABC transport system ATP-binding protein